MAMACVSSVVSSRLASRLKMVRLVQLVCLSLSLFALASEALALRALASALGALPAKWLWLWLWLWLERVWELMVWGGPTNQPTLRQTTCSAARPVHSRLTSSFKTMAKARKRSEIYWTALFFLRTQALAGAPSCPCQLKFATTFACSARWS